MLISKIRLEPFAGFSSLQYAFKPGLNVVLGPNEAGKTTLVNAIHAALFIPPGVGRGTRDWKNMMARYLPHPQGDTARVVLQAVDGEGEDLFKLHCAWGGEKEARLVLAGGAEIADEKAIRAELGRLLRHNRATYEQVFLARQAELIETLERIKVNPEALRTLGDMLRAMIFESGGVSVDTLKFDLDQAIRALENNWDTDNDAPRAGRGLDNPHRQRVGQILEQYYGVCRLQRDLRAAEQAEEALEKALKQLEKLETRYKKVNDKESAMAALEKDIRLRSTREPELRALELQYKQLGKITLAWPKTEENLRHVKKGIEGLPEEKKRLEDEYRQSQEQRVLKEKRAIYHKAAGFEEKLRAKKDALAALPLVTAEEMTELEEMDKALAGIRAEIEGMKLKIRLKTAGTTRVKVKQALEADEALVVKGEQVFAARGRFSLAAADWSIDVQSGVKDVQGLLLSLETLENKLKSRLAGLQLAELEKAREAHRAVNALKGEIQTLKGRLDDALQGHSLEKLKKELAEAGEEKAVRDPLDINKDLVTIEQRLKGLEEKKEELEGLLRGWVEEYGDPDQALDKLVELRGGVKAIEAKLKGLKALPAGYDSAEKFLSELDALRKTKETVRETLIEARENKIKAEGAMPEESPEEIKDALRYAEKALQDLKDKAAALRVVEMEFNRLKKEMDAQTFTKFEERFLDYLAPLTGNRYREARMQAALPAGIAPAEGADPLPLELLSCGTISGVALALRLAIAEYLFESGEGFIVMDDPLVDLDPARKAKAADVLRRAARDTQIIITTFDPETAELLGGHTITL